MLRRVFFAAIFALISASCVEAADRALLVGVEHYRDARVPMAPGCARDAVSLAGFIQRRFGFSASSVKVLTDEQASRAAIEKEFKNWLIRDTAPGDRVFFLFAGRGTQLVDEGGDEDDGFDEAIVPYDVDPGTGANVISDDIFDGWIAQLSGRRAVLMFDSCFSGTISRGVPSLKEFPKGGGVRYLPRPDQLRALSGLMRGGHSGDASYVLRGSVTRGMEHVSSFIKPREGVNLSGIVIISAAQSDQLAYPVRINGNFRGALSYLFEEVQSQAPPTLRNLKELISENMRRMRQAGVLDGNQMPQFEVISSVSLENHPLFGSWEVSPAVALFNPLSRIRVSLRTAGGKWVYTSEDKISYEVSTDAEGYLYLLVFSQQNAATCIFPSSYDLDNHVLPGTHTLPRSSAYNFPITEPFGRDVTVAVLAKERLNLCEKVEYSWSEIFDRLGLQNLRQRVTEQATRGVGVRPAKGLPLASDWQASSVITETRR